MSKDVRRLFQQFQPENYQLDIKLDKKNLTFAGTVTIKGRKVGRPSQRLTFHQKDLKITQATITKHDKGGATEIPVVRINRQNTLNEVRLHTDGLLYPANYSVQIEFSGQIQKSMHGVYVCNYRLGDKDDFLIATQFESHHAREAFPCIDEPEAKATFNLSLTIPKGETALSNMPEVNQTAGKTQQTITFEPTPKMSTYLLAWVIGDLQSKKATTKNGTEVAVWSTKAQPLESHDFSLKTATKAIEIFNDFYGVPYPLPKSDHVALPDFSSAAMENWGLVTYREAFLLDDPETSSQSSRELISMVVSHELSHQWFGNLVTMKWWDDLWLNESFANVMEYVAVDRLQPKWGIWNSFITREGLAALRRDCIDGVQAIKTKVSHPDEILTLFDPSIVYAKGGRLLYMLMQYVGEADFRKSLTAYFTKHEYGNTTGNDLWQAIGEHSGKDISDFMRPWLEQPGYPVLTVSQEDDVVSVSQKRFFLSQDSNCDDSLWPVPLLPDDAGLPALLDTQALQTKVKGDSFVRINVGAIGHYIVHYTNPTHIQHIAKQAASQQLTVPERLMFLSDNIMIAKSGLQSFDRTLELLDYYKNEDAEPVWDIIALAVAEARRFIDIDESLESPIKAYIRKLIEKQYRRLGWEESKDESSQDTKLRATIIGLGVYSRHPEITKVALSKFGAYKKDRAAVPSELRPVIMSAAIRNEAPGAFEWLLKLEEETQNADLKPDIMSALSLVQDQKRAALLLARIKDSKKVRLHDIDGWIALLMRNRKTRELAWQWLRDNWSWIENTLANDKSYDYLPRYAAGALATRKHLAEYEEFFGPLRTQPVLKRNIAMGIQELKDRIDWLERDLKAVRRYMD